MEIKQFTSEKWTHINSNWIIGLHVRPETLKSININWEKKIFTNLHRVILIKAERTLTTKEKNDKLGFVELKTIKKTI